MKFGVFLYHRGVISAEELIRAVELRDQYLMPLGVIAMEEGKLAVRDVLRVLRVQSDYPNDRFGDIAIDMGLLTGTEIAELLMMQSDRQPSLGHCLVELGILSSEQVALELSEFRRHRERGGAAQVQRVLATIPDGVDALRQSTAGTR